MVNMTYNLLNLYKFVEAMIDAGVIQSSDCYDNSSLSAILIECYYPTSSEDSLLAHLRAIRQILDESSDYY